MDACISQYRRRFYCGWLFYAKQLAQNLHVTVGLVSSSWGGTEAEDWISKETLSASPELNTIVPTLPKNADELNQRSDKLLKAWAYKNTPVANYTVNELAAKPANFFDGWQHGNVPSSWEWVGRLYSYRGTGFMQRTISLDSLYSPANSTISLGVTDADMRCISTEKLITKAAPGAVTQYNVPPEPGKAG